MRDRADRAGLGQRQIAGMLGWSDTRVSRGMDRAAPEIAMLLCAWEIMTLAQRRQWLDALGVTIERRRPGRPRKQ